jgi:hypothetical protein
MSGRKTVPRKEGDAMRRPWMTTEFWVAMGAVVAQTTGWVDFPREATGTILVWILGRALHKGMAAKNGVST